MQSDQPQEDGQTPVQDQMLLEDGMTPMQDHLSPNPDNELIPMEDRLSPTSKASSQGTHNLVLMYPEKPATPPKVQYRDTL